MRPRAERAGAVAALALGMALAAGVARADEGDHALSVSLSYGRYSIPDPELSANGGVLGVDYERGVSEALWLRVSAGGGLYRGDGQTTYSGQATVGATYALDVIKYVPYFNAGLGAIVIGGGDLDTDVAALLEIGAGVDVLHSRSLSYGVVVRFESFLEKTSFFTAGVRATYRWGFF
jgi:hypothetical protein